MANRTIGERIKNRRIELGMTQEELAVKIGYTSKSTINKIELGINQLRQTKIIQIAKALDISVDYILDGEEESTQPPISSISPEILEELSKLDERKQVLVLAYLKAINGEV